MPTFYTFAVDEYGVGYDSMLFETVDDAEMYLSLLKDQEETFTNSALSAMITSLEDQLTNYKEARD